MSLRAQMESFTTDRKLWIFADVLGYSTVSANTNPKLVLISLRLPKQISDKKSFVFLGQKLINWFF